MEQMPFLKELQKFETGHPPAIERVQNEGISATAQSGPLFFEIESHVH